jgi:hypothetical protein
MPRVLVRLGIPTVIFFRQDPSLFMIVEPMMIPNVRKALGGPDKYSTYTTGCRQDSQHLEKFQLLSSNDFFKDSPLERYNLY